MENLDELELQKAIEEEDLEGLEDLMEDEDYESHYSEDDDEEDDDEEDEHHHKCCECGELFRDSDLVMDEDDNLYCPTCADDYLYWCDHCERYVHDETTDVISRGNRIEHWCQNCLDEDAFYCDYCEEYHDTQYYEEYTAYRDGYEINVCESCITESGDFYFCDECEDWFHSDDWNFDQDCCINCEREDGIIRGWHDHKNGFDWVATSFDEEREGLGIELEVDLGTEAANCAEEINDTFTNHFVFERDGSLSDDGFEIISQPHTVEAFYLVDWERLFVILDGYGYEPDVSCGLHVHVSNIMLGDTEQQQNIAKLLITLFYQKYWDIFVKLSRRKSEYQIEHYCHKTYISAEDVRNYYEAIKQHSLTRYRAVNVLNADTTEFRLCASTFDIDHFLSWIDTTLTLVKNAMEIVVFGIDKAKEITIYSIENDFDKFMEDVMVPDEMLHGLKKSTLDFFEKEGIKFDIATEEKVSL